MLSARQLSPDEALFTFVTTDDRDGIIHVATDRLRAYVEGIDLIPIHWCPWTPSLLRALERNAFGVEEDHAARLPEAALDLPVLCGITGEQHLLMDGNHRVWRRWKRRDEGFHAYMVPEKVWWRFTVSDIPGSRADWEDYNRNARVRNPRGGWLPPGVRR